MKIIFEARPACIAQMFLNFSLVFLIDLFLVQKVYHKYLATDMYFVGVLDNDKGSLEAVAVFKKNGGAEAMNLPSILAVANYWSSMRVF